MNTLQNKLKWQFLRLFYLWRLFVTFKVISSKKPPKIRREEIRKIDCVTEAKCIQGKSTCLPSPPPFGRRIRPSTGSLIRVQELATKPGDTKWWPSSWCMFLESLWDMGWKVPGDCGEAWTEAFDVIKCHIHGPNKKPSPRCDLSGRDWRVDC